MTNAGWFMLGAAAAIVVAAPVLMILLRRVEARARDAERRARDAERLAELGSMTSGLAHEIKNPLSTIGLNAQLLSEAIGDLDLPDESRQQLHRRVDALSREAERLRGILTDFLQFAGRIKLDPQPVDLVQVVDELQDFFHPQCDQQGVMLRTQLPNAPVMAQIDVRLFKQALLNLMINAVQAMQPPASAQRGDGINRTAGQSKVRTGELMLRLDADADTARLHVIDTGPGIEPDRLDQIFLPYVSHKVGGTGLGLPTARRIIEEHGGRLHAHSEPGRGSDFLIELPRAST